MTFSPDTRADLARFMETLDVSSGIGTGRPGGLSRLALSEADREMRDTFCGWCRDLGLTLEIDSMGNIFASYEGTEPDLPPVYVGSHLDTQDNGGRYDGIAGVLAGLELLRVLFETGHRPRRRITLVNWTNEEGARFNPAMIASGVFVGRYEEDWAKAITDKDGITQGAALEAIGYAGDRPCRAEPVDGYFELHIEQGPILDAAGMQVGVVTGGYPTAGMRVQFTGETAHTGPTPMDRRRNALVAGARWLTLVDDMGWEFAVGDGKASAVHLSATPNRPGILSDAAEAICDCRHPDPAAVRAMAEKMRRLAQEAAARAGCTAEVVDAWTWNAEEFDAGMVALVRGEAERQGWRWREIHSQAGHDAYQMALHCPVAMVFTPCRDGITHNNNEFCAPEDLEPALNVLLHAVVARADR